MYKIFNNVENKIIAILNSDIEFIEFMNRIAVENEEEPDFCLGYVEDAIAYLQDYCDNLNLIV